MKNVYQQFYSNSYKHQDSKKVSEMWVKKVQSKLHIKFSPKKRVLDIACGVSTLGKAFSNDVYAFDLNPQAIKVVNNNGIKGKIGNVEEKWKYPNEYFDIVIASHIIEHVVNPDHIILEAKRVLKKGGLLVIATPNLAAWFNRILLLMGFQPFFTEVSTIDKTLGLTFTRKLTPLRSPLGHLRVFTAQALIDLLELHKFKVLKVFGVEFLAFPKILLLVDKLFSHIISFSSNIIIVGKK